MTTLHDRNHGNSGSLEPAVFLLPVPLSDNDIAEVIPAYNIEIIRNIKHFIVENTRTARRFLKKFDKSLDIDGLTFIELNEHTDEADIPAMLEPVSRGEAIGVMSEAGCPAVADPGARLVALAQQHGIKTVPLVGPSSILLSLMASGLNGQTFSFVGYLPIDDKQRSEALRRMSTHSQKTDTTYICIETPYRNQRLFDQLVRTLPGNMRMCIAVDVTGRRQSIVTRTVSEWKKSDVRLDKIPAIFLFGN